MWSLIVVEHRPLIFTRLWSYTTANVVDSPPAVANAMVYVPSKDGKIYAFGLQKGRE